MTNPTNGTIRHPSLKKGLVAHIRTAKVTERALSKSRQFLGSERWVLFFDFHLECGVRSVTFAVLTMYSHSHPNSIFLQELKKIFWREGMTIDIPLNDFAILSFEKV